MEQCSAQPVDPVLPSGVAGLVSRGKFGPRVFVVLLSGRLVVFLLSLAGEPTPPGLLFVLLLPPLLAAADAP